MKSPTLITASLATLLATTASVYASPAERDHDDDRRVRRQQSERHDVGHRAAQWRRHDDDRRGHERSDRDDDRRGHERGDRDD